VPEPSRRVGEGGSGKQGRAKDPGVGTDQQGLSILRISARQHDKGPSAIRFWEAAAVPARRPAALTGKQPDLEELKRVFAVIALQMADPGAGAHHLDVALYCPTDVAGAIFVCNDALADIGDDFPRLRESDGRNPCRARSRRRSRARGRGRNDEVVARLQPAAIAVVERFFGSKL
jgi:hypothetical protein